MQFSLAATLCLLTSVQAAFPTITTHTYTAAQLNAENYTWTVSDWTTSCATTSNCSYSFNVTGAEQSSTTPAFSASCSGTGVGASYRRCNVPQEDSSQTHVLQLVAARLDATNGTNSDAHLVVSYQINNASAATAWNYTAYVTEPYDASGSTFTLTPSEIWAAA